MQENSKEMKKVIVEIIGNEYTLLSDDDEKYILTVAQEVNNRIKTLVNSDLRMTAIMATTLACLEYCDDLIKEREISKNLRAQVQDYIKEINNGDLAKEKEVSENLRSQIQDYIKEIDKEKEKYKKLEEKLKVFENEKNISKKISSQTEEITSLLEKNNGSTEKKSAKTANNKAKKKKNINTVVSFDEKASKDENNYYKKFF